MGAQIPKVVKVNQLLHIHSLAFETCIQQLPTMQVKDMSFTWIVVYLRGNLHEPFDNLRVRTRQILFHILNPFSNVTEGKRVTTGASF